MESQEMRVTEDQNLERPKSGSVLQLFADFYGMETVHTYREVQRVCGSGEAQGPWVTLKKLLRPLSTICSVRAEDYLSVTTTRPITEQSYLHLPAYRQRIRLAAEVLLAEANSRAVLQGKKAYIQVFQFIKLVTFFVTLGGRSGPGGLEDLCTAEHDLCRHLPGGTGGFEA